MRVPVDERAVPLLERYMRVLLPEFHFEVRGLKRRPAKRIWARGNWLMSEEHVTFEWGHTQELSGHDLEAVVAHEVAHGLYHKARSCAMGSLTDEQLCDRLARMLVPGTSRPFRRIPDVANLTRAFNDDEREALEDVLPHMLVRMPAEHREVLCWFFYDYPDLGLRELAKVKDIPKTTLARRRDDALTALREMFR